MNHLIQDFQSHLAKSDLSPNTIRCYTLDLTAFSEWFTRETGEQADIQSITPLDISDWREKMLKDKKPATINRRLVSVSKFCQWGVKEGLIPDNPSENIKGVEEVELSPKSLTRKDQLALMRAVRKHARRMHLKRDETILTVLLHTGLRVGEVADLKVGDVVMSNERNVITIRQGKGRKARVVPLNPTAVKALKDYFNSLDDSFTVSETPESKAVFFGQKGLPLTTRGIHGLVSKYAYYAKLENVHPHSLRHTCAKNLINAGVPIDRVAKVMGHANLNTTTRYTLPSEHDLAKAMDTIAWE